jgi:membrane-associated phospholipid phosphatase
MDNIQYTIDLIGFHGPIIAAVITLTSLFYQKPFLYAFILFSILNYVINGLLKSSIREPRPSGSIPIHDLDKEDGNKTSFGMPSGHAQLIFFSTTFLYLVKKNTYLLLFELFLCALTLYQRWKYRKHSVQQLLVGSGVGAGFAYGAYSLTHYYLTR